jgi:hypothetical protein
MPILARRPSRLSRRQPHPARGQLITVVSNEISLLSSPLALVIGWLHGHDNCLLPHPSLG